LISGLKWLTRHTTLLCVMILWFCAIPFTLTQAYQFTGFIAWSDALFNENHLYLTVMIASRFVFGVLWVYLAYTLTEIGTKYGWLYSAHQSPPPYPQITSYSQDYSMRIILMLVACVALIVFSEIAIRGYSNTMDKLFFFYL
jgi:hypothetical protein